MTGTRPLRLSLACSLEALEAAIEGIEMALA
jgi:hypothetical protein